MNQDKQPEALHQIGDTQKELVKKLCENSTEQLWLSYCNKKMEVEDLEGDLESARQRIAELEAELAAVKAAPVGVEEALDRMDELLKPENGLLTVGNESATAEASLRDMAVIRSALAAQQAQDVQDAGLLDWLSKQYIGPDFRWGDPVTEVVVIEMPKGCSYCGDFKVDMRAAIAASAKGGV